MIYLIGGPPKCGKTTLAKKLSSTLKIPRISTDALQSVVQAYTPKAQIAKKFPWNVRRQQTKRINDLAYNKFTAREIIRCYRTQAQSVFKAIEMLAISELADGNDLIIEGYHVEPALIEKLRKKYGSKDIRGIFLVKTDTLQFAENIVKTNTPNDWIIARTINVKTYVKIAQMICQYCKIIEAEAERRDLEVLNMDQHFNAKINEAIGWLKKQTK